MKVYQLKEQFEHYLAILENYDDDRELNLESNTYYLGHPKYFLGISGWSDGGYLNLDELEDNIIINEGDEEGE